MAGWLGKAGIDLLEISGGTYEKLAFVEGGSEDARAESTRRREAYFLKYAELIRQACGAPLMVTGGFRTRALMNEVLAAGELDVIGLGRPFCLDPDVARKLLREQVDELPSPERSHQLGGRGLGPGSSNSTVRALNSQGSTAWYYEHIYALADGGPLPSKMSVRAALRRHYGRELRVAAARKRRGRKA